MDRKVLEFYTPEIDAAVERGIEQNRKGRFKAVVRDKNGNPVKNAALRLKQKTHEFRFGANIFMLDELPTDEKNAIYKEKFAALFNLATLPFYWDALEPTPGHTRYAADSEKIYRRPAPDRCLAFCEAHGIEPREHALCYDHFFPTWLSGKSDFEVKRALTRRMREISERYADKIPTIEVTNESYWEKSVTDFYRSPEFVEWCFKTAEKYFPENKLCINEWSEMWEGEGRCVDRYFMQVENALLKGARIDAVGMQFHMFYREEEYYRKTRRQYDPERQLRVLDNFARLGKPIQITEITVPAFTDNAADEQLQADTIEKLYKLWFSHPAVEQIVYWNLADGYAAFTTPGNMTEGENYYRGGLLRYDLGEKPAYKTLDRLINREWRTDTTVTTDENGCATLCGFYGDYELTNGNKTVSLSLVKNACRTIDVKF